MKNKEMIKPFIWGAVLGALAIMIVGFSANWVVSNSSKEKQVEAAWIDGQAIVCSTIAQARRVASGDKADISGYDAREVREKLATEATTILPDQDAADWRVVRSCADKIRDAVV